MCLEEGEIIRCDVLVANKQPSLLYINAGDVPQQANVIYEQWCHQTVAASGEE